MDDGPADFAEFVRARYDALTRSAYLLTGDRGSAEDAVQSALMKTLAAWDRLEAREAAETYTRTTMVRLVGRWRRRRWRGEIPTPRQEFTDSTGEALGTDRDMDGLRVRDLLIRLPYEQRAVLVLRYFADLSERPTAEVMACSVGTVKSRTSRALAALRDSGLLMDREEAHDG